MPSTFKSKLTNVTEDKAKYKRQAEARGIALTLIQRDVLQLLKVMIDNHHIEPPIEDIRILSDASSDEFPMVVVNQVKAMCATCFEMQEAFTEVESTVNDIERITEASSRDFSLYGEGDLIKRLSALTGDVTGETPAEAYTGRGQPSTPTSNAAGANPRSSPLQPSEVRSHIEKPDMTHEVPSKALAAPPDDLYTGTPKISSGSDLRKALALSQIQSQGNDR